MTGDGKLYDNVMQLHVIEWTQLRSSHLLVSSDNYYSLKILPVSKIVALSLPLGGSVSVL